MNHTISWMSSDGSHRAPFNADYFKVDALGYLDALRKGGDMFEVSVVDDAGDDVTQKIMY